MGRVCLNLVYSLQLTVDSQEKAGRKATPREVYSLQFTVDSQEKAGRKATPREVYSL